MTEEIGMVQVNSHRLAYTCMGSGSPVVVLEAGGGTPRRTWSIVMPKIASIARVVSYDRAGVGESEPGGRGRTGDDLVQDLAHLLHNLGILAPYIMVGNSLGGNIIRYFADQYPGEVVGMILLDSVHPDQHRQALALMPPPTPTDSSDLTALRRNLTNVMSGIINEQDPEGLNFLAFDDQVRKTGSMGNLPLVVVSAGNQARPDLPLAYIQAYHKMAREFQVELSQLSTRGKHIIVERSGHFIQEDEPDLVVAVVREMVEQARQGAT